MNKLLTTQSITAPSLPVYASGTPQQRYKHVIRPENPWLIFGPIPRWTCCMTSRLDGQRHRSDLLLRIGDRRPVYGTVGVSPGVWDPGRYPVTSVRCKPPIRPEAAAPAAPIASTALAVEPSVQPIRPEKARTATRPRNDNRQGNPNAARRPIVRQNSPYDQETDVAVRGLMSSDVSAWQATLLTTLIRDAAQPARAPAIQPIRPGDKPETATFLAPSPPSHSGRPGVSNGAPPLSTSPHRPAMRP